MATVKLTNAARAALKTALRGKVEGLDTMRKVDLIAAAETHGLNVQGVIYNADHNATVAAIGRPDPAVLPDTLQEAVDPPETDTAIETIDAAQRDVQSILDAWRDMDTGTFRARLDTLAARANKPPVVEVREVERIVERIVEVERAPCSLPAGSHVAQRIGSKLASEIFGSAVTGKHAAIKLALWDHPKAPKPDDHYAWPAGTGILIAAMFRAHQPVMAWGPKGSGKTSFFKEIAARLGRPFFRISCNAQTEAPVLIGQRVPSADGGTEWKDGILTLAMRTPGAVLLIDEVSTLREGVAHILQSVLDDKVIHIDETGEVVHAADGLVIGLADNTNGSGDATGSYAGTRMMNAATIDRPEVTVRISHLAPAREASIVTAKTGCSPALAALLCDYAHVTRQKSDTGELSEGISTRRVLSWARTLMHGADVVDAAEAAFLDRSRPEEVETLCQLIQTHCDPAKITAALEGSQAVPSEPPVRERSKSGFAPISS